jgi:ribosomal protein S18 acetylase RimI-like enzyme
MTVSNRDSVLTLRAEANLAAAIRVWATAAEGGELLESPGLIALRVDAPLRAFNQAILLDRESVARDLGTAAAWFDDRPRFRIRLREELVRGQEAPVAAAGLTSHGGIPSLALAPISAVEASDIPGVVIRSVDETNLSDHVSVVQGAFDWEDRALATVFTTRLLHDPAWHAYVAYMDGEPAATAQLVVAGAVAGLYYIGTRAGFRSRGFGEAVTRHAIHHGAALGCEMASLQASPAGYPVYKRIGFEDVAYYRTYVGVDAS